MRTTRMIVQGIMKKMCMLIFALMSSVAGFTQVSEVKGVETKLVVYDGSEYSVRTGRSRSGNSYYSSSTKWFGYSFYNMNSIPVSVEARLYEFDEYYGPKKITTKTFNLKPGETYIWKHENMDAFMVNCLYCPHCDSRWTDGNTEPRSSDYSNNSYYVEYTAYKIL